MMLAITNNPAIRLALREFSSRSIICVMLSIMGMSGVEAIMQPPSTMFPDRITQKELETICQVDSSAQGPVLLDSTGDNTHTKQVNNFDYSKPANETVVKASPGYPPAWDW